MVLSSFDDLQNQDRNVMSRISAMKQSYFVDTTYDKQPSLTMFHSKEFRLSQEGSRTVAIFSLKFAICPKWCSFRSTLLL